LIPQIKNEKELIFFYGYDIILDASLSKDEKLMRSKQSYKPDLELLFAWECPFLFKNICKQFSEFSNNIKKLTIRFADYQTLIEIATNEREDFNFFLNWKKIIDLIVNLLSSQYRIGRRIIIINTKILEMILKKSKIL